MKRRELLRKSGAGIAATVLAAGTASAGSAEPQGTECPDGCIEYCPSTGGCYWIC